MLYSQRLYPFIDLPYHLATATVIKYYGAAANNFSTYFTITDTFIRPHALHALFCSLNLFPSIEFGNKIFFCLYALLFPFSVLLLVFKFKGNFWFSILSFLLLYNFNMCWGFAEYTFSIPLFLLFFYVLTCYLEKASFFNSFSATVMFLMLFFMHSLTTIFALLVFTVCLGFKYKSEMAAGLKKSIIALPVIILMLSSKGSVTGQGLFVTLKRLCLYYINEYPHEIPGRASHLLFSDNFFLFPGAAGKIWALVFSSAMLFPFVFALLCRRKKLLAFFKDPGKQPLLLLFLCALGCCCFLPSGILNAWAIYQRFSVILFAIVIVINSVFYAEKLRPLLVIYIITVCVLHYGLWNNYYTEFSEENKTFTPALFPEAEKDATLGAQIFEHDYRGRAVYVHFPNYYITWKQGIAVSSIINFGQTGVKRKVGQDFLPAYEKWQEKMWRQHGDRYYKYSGIREAVSPELLPVYNAWLGSKLKQYDNRYKDTTYVLTRGDSPKEAGLYLKNFELVRSTAKWHLYQNRKRIN